ncbi:hypothetical protein T265_03567 [Opisthorchis viverrini]|uniref:Mediator of RNA polymerase II transcription subunit 8 n=1 Tax=Opisthorchis viverrini TaxID=6198 RepID=A0A075AHH0_OPIVI|nr:hypothetical protein T265_03567 [Opisthorchis viverrini]KER29869.1 hypothetical protein T265_03567 [Opisthorchis viverrini]
MEARASGTTEDAGGFRKPRGWITLSLQAETAPCFNWFDKRVKRRRVSVRQCARKTKWQFTPSIVILSGGLSTSKNVSSGLLQRNRWKNQVGPNGTLTPTHHKQPESTRQGTWPGWCTPRTLQRRWRGPDEQSDKHCRRFGTKTIPAEWSASTVIPVFKKGARPSCKNHRGINLVSVVSKVLSGIILRRFLDYRERHIRENQAGFRRGRGCIDHIFTLRQTLEQRRPSDIPRSCDKADGSITDEVNARIVKALSTSFRVRHPWRSSNIRLPVKDGIYSVPICPATERRQMESVKTLYNALYKLKQKVQDLVIKLETQGESCDWPRYLSTLALCASELSEIRKVLESDRFSSEHTLALTPMLLNPEPDPTLAKATEDRLALFNHDTVPQYLRTKLDPKLESQCLAQSSRASAVPSDQLTKLINQTNRAVDASLKEVSLLKQELEADFSDRQSKTTGSVEDFNALLSLVISGKGLNTTH